MRYFTYHEPIFDSDGVLIGDEVVVRSEEDVRREYFPYWEREMIKKYGEDEYRRRFSFQDCLDDFMVDRLAYDDPETFV